MIRTRRWIPVIAVPFAVLVAAAGCSDSPRHSDGRDGAVDAGTNDRQMLEASPDLLIPDVVPASSDRCGGGPSIDLSQGKTVLQGSTADANNEYGQGIRCGGSIGFAGPQRYFRLELTVGNTYRLTVEPQFDAVAYLFSSCAANVINADCGSDGATGATTGPIAAGGMGSMLFIPRASGTYLFAIDSASAESAGEFSLTAESFAQPQHAKCSAAQPIALVDGAVTVKDSTLGAANEFGTAISCGLGLSLDGPQLYYSLELQAGNWYRFSIDAEFDAALYVVNSAGDCKAANVEQDCSSIIGTVLPLVSKGQLGATAFSPLTSGTYIVAVDSLEPLATGNFTLNVEQYSPPANMVCASASAVTLTGGEAVIDDDTTTYLNDRGAQMSCGSSPLVGPQAYYQLALEQKSYLLALTTPFDAVLAVGQSCLTLPVDCDSTGLSGAALAVGAGTTGKLYFTPPSAGNYVIAVEGATTTASGELTLSIAEASNPTNGSCSQPQPLALGTAPQLIAGNTGQLSNDLNGVDCGSAVGPWIGPQAYYRLSLKGGQSYELELEPEPTFDPALYAFIASTACEAAAINSACSALYSDQLGGGIKETLTLTPASDVDYIIVVDSWSPSDVGTFTLRISPK